jgi:diacylglycerol kinase
MSQSAYEPPHRSWPTKFREALVAILRAVREQTSFHIHLLFTVLVLAAAAVLRLDRMAWCLLLLCITIVLAAETFNTALETLAKAVDERYNPHLATALNLASGAVLLTALGAVAVGALIFIPRLLELLGG